MVNKKDLNYYVCPLCKSELIVKNNIIKCTQCDSSFNIINDIPVFLNEKIIPQNYEKQTNYFDEEYSNIKISLQPWQKSYINLMKKSFKSKVNYLDIGVGSGYSVIYFSKVFRNVFGCDLSLKSIMKIKRYCEKNKIKNVNLCVASAEYLPYKDDFFVNISSNAVIEHVPDEKRFVNEILRISKKNSIIFLTAPIKFKYINPLFWGLNLIHDKIIGHLRRYDINYFNKIFKNKLKIIKVYYTGHLIKSFLFLLNLFLKSDRIAKIAEKYDKKSLHKKFNSNNIIVVLKK